MNKDLIKKRFSKNLSAYNENAKIQKIMAERLISLIEKTEFEHILEIGCGTGFLTELGASRFKFQTYTANDIVPECREYVKKINPKIEFVCSDIEKSVRNSSKTYDLIISNATLQWIDNLGEFAEELLAKLSKGGILAFSTFGKENFKEISHVTGMSLKYNSKADLDIIFHSKEHLIEEELRILQFDTPKEVLKHIHLTGVNALEARAWTKSDLKNFENAYNIHCMNAPQLTYNPLYIVIKN